MGSRLRTPLLNLIDLTLTANLVLIVICSSYENFVCPIEYSNHPNWPHGLINIGFSGLQQKLLGSIVAIAAVNVLEWFTDIDRGAVAMLVLAIADRVTGEAKPLHREGPN